MLSPNVWDIKPPQHHFSSAIRKFQGEDLPNELKTSYFHHSVCFVLPDAANVPETLQSHLTEDTEYYRVDAVPLTELIAKEFIEGFVKHGELTALSIERKIDVDNCIAVTPTGFLILSLVAEDFQKLGLEGKPSFFDRGPSTRYVVTIDLKGENFTPGRKTYDHVYNSLQKHLDQTFNLILAWDPPETRLCPSSVAAWFHNRGYNVSLCRQKLMERSEYSVTVPTAVDGCDADKIFEWLGVFSICGNLMNKDEAEKYVSSYECPEPSMYVGQVQYLQSSGFFTRKGIQKIYNAVRTHALSHSNSLWVSLHVQGFADAVVATDLKQHDFFVDGDNSCTIIFRNNGTCIVRKSSSSNSKPRICQ